MPVVKTPDVLGGEPRLDGHRISVLQVVDPVLAGNDPAYVADQLDVTLAEVHVSRVFTHARASRGFGVPTVQSDTASGASALPSSTAPNGASRTTGGRCQRLPGVDSRGAGSGRDTHSCP